MDLGMTQLTVHKVNETIKTADLNVSFWGFQTCKGSKHATRYRKVQVVYPFTSRIKFKLDLK